MKINPEVGTLINVLKQGEKPEKKTVEANLQKQKIADSISLENRQASNNEVQNVEDAKEILTQVVGNMPSQASGLYTLNLQRVINLIQ
ncbi:MAG: hypothetical protein ABFD81_15545 [Syntrophaceae bacterium]